MNNKIYYKSGYKYQNAKDYIIETGVTPIKDTVFDFLEITETGRLTIKKGYAWDGCSGPTWDDKRNMRAGMVHDALYQLMRHGAVCENNRSKIDKLFHKILLEDKMSRFRAWYYYNAVKKFAKFASSKKAIRKIEEAP